MWLMARARILHHPQVKHYIQPLVPCSVRGNTWLDDRNTITFSSLSYTGNTQTHYNATPVIINDTSIVRLTAVRDKIPYVHVYMYAQLCKMCYSSFLDQADH
jgi:hypothetical protein